MNSKVVAVMGSARFFMMLLKAYVWNQRSSRTDRTFATVADPERFAASSASN
jgi:hypothetical protein